MVKRRSTWGTEKTGVCKSIGPRYGHGMPKAWAMRSPMSSCRLYNMIREVNSSKQLPH